MNIKTLEQLLDEFKKNKICKDDVINKLKKLPFEDLDFAKIDHHRSLRTGYPEVIFCQGKTNEHIKDIYLSLANNNKSLLLTRANRDIFDLLHKIDNRIKYNELSRTISLEVSKNKKRD